MPPRLFYQDCVLLSNRAMMRSNVLYRIATQGVSLQQAVLQHAAWSGNAEVIQVLWEKHDARLDVRALS